MAMGSPKSFNNEPVKTTRGSSGQRRCHSPASAKQSGAGVHARSWHLVAMEGSLEGVPRKVLQGFLRVFNIGA